jgi:hypothetical protein
MSARRRKSKELFSTNEPEPPKPVFFVESGLGRGLVNTLKSLGFQVEWCLDHFPDNAGDDVWIPEVSRRGWVALTADKAIRHSYDQQQAVRSCTIRLFTLQARKVNGKAISEIFSFHIEAICRIAAEQEPPFIAGVYRDDVKLLELPHLRPPRRSRDR